MKETEDNSEVKIMILLYGIMIVLTILSIYYEN